MLNELQVLFLRLFQIGWGLAQERVHRLLSLDRRVDNALDLIEKHLRRHRMFYVWAEVEESIYDPCSKERFGQ